MQYTANYHLALPDGTDNVDVAILNGNMSAIDTILTDIYSKLPTPPPAPAFPVTLDVNDFAFASEAQELTYTGNATLGIDTNKVYQVVFSKGSSDYTPVTPLVLNYKDFGLAEDLYGLFIDMTGDGDIPEELKGLATTFNLLDGVTAATFEPDFDVTFGNGFIVLFQTDSQISKSDILAVFDTITINEITE